MDRKMAGWQDGGMDGMRWDEMDGKMAGWMQLGNGRMG